MTVTTINYLHKIISRVNEIYFNLFYELKWSVQCGIFLGSFSCMSEGAFEIPSPVVFTGSLRRYMLEIGVKYGVWWVVAVEPPGNSEPFF